MNMTGEVHFEITSPLTAPADVVWKHAGSMAGVNYELMPLVRMTAPRRFRELHIEDWVSANENTRTGIFTSLILLGGILPYDLHFFGMERVDPGRGFAEHSTTLFMRHWRHTRRVEPTGDSSCTVTDVIACTPRLPLIAPLVRPIFRLVFAHRHRRLRAKFGTV
jgi:ligand-binding SRPBCC domain-containing protein